MAPTYEPTSTPDASEETTLLHVSAAGPSTLDTTCRDITDVNATKRSYLRKIVLYGGVFTLTVGFVFVVLSRISKETTFQSTASASYHQFPDDFSWGAATSSYQIEGATNEGGRGLSIWDTFCQKPGKIADNSTGDVACDHYHRFREDVQLMKELGLKAYRFSIAWPRIFPNGNDEKPNPEGISFYNHLIDELLKNDIEPWVTLYHWDLPQALEDSYGGWLNTLIVEDFGTYATTCFEAFGDRVRNWITINEAWTVAVQAYEDGTKAPGKVVNPPVDVYVAGHHLLLAHARAASIYKRDFAPTQHGMIGMSNCGDFRYPLDPASLEDSMAAERAMVFQYSWFTDPLVYGDYPDEMRARLGDRLPKFTPTDSQELVDSLDFMGLNHYSTLYASTSSSPSHYDGYWNDMDVEFSSDDAWRKNYMGWSTNPDGCKELLLWIGRRYPTLPIVITENGTSEYEPDMNTAIADEGRRQYFESYIRASGEAIDLGVHLIGYFAWSLFDNFEWEYGYTRRFGLCHVDFQTLERTPKSSALWYRDTIRAHGSNLQRSGQR
ncbi:BGL: beta-galactosidase [Nitzschia inconspicua]|uniref:beta-glucosidase n=1 Tax=Nitzschia inconspicua TaxID=303405 RepID=A0A9K3L5Q0_9STRA|nr:BGL: beta-galactosidase [Nitzschia inconspicua]